MESKNLWINFRTHFIPHVNMFEQKLIKRNWFWLNRNYVVCTLGKQFELCMYNIRSQIKWKIREKKIQNTNRLDCTFGKPRNICRMPHVWWNNLVQLPIRTTQSTTQIKLKKKQPTEEKHSEMKRSTANPSILLSHQ